MTAPTPALAAPDTRARVREARDRLVRRGVNAVPEVDRLLGELLADLEPPASETVAAKARRYLAEGRLVVTQVDAATIAATCRGAGAVYRLGWSGRWSCSCPARTDRCAHLTALRLVTAQPDGAAGADGATPPLEPHRRSETITGGASRRTGETR